MSRKNKNLRAFLHQNQNPTIEQAWDAAWKHAQKKFHARSMQDMEKQVADLQAECTLLREQLDAMAEHKMAEGERDRYQAGNTELLELLMSLIDGQDSTELLARIDAVLKGANLLHENGTPNWEALEARKPKQIPWEQAVNELVTDPEERARLLAMADGA